jgi:hypothetical protein
MGTSLIAGTKLNWDGKIVTEYYEKYYDLTPIEQEGVRVHEAIHVAQLEPYADRGWWGVLQGKIAYATNASIWEVQAYKAEYDFLLNYPTQNLTQLMKDVVYYRSTFVSNNMQYYCGRVSGTKPAGC